MPGTAGLPSMGLFSPDVHLRLSHSRINPGKTDFLHGSWVSREEGPKIESQGCVPFTSKELYILILNQCSLEVKKTLEIKI